MIAASRTPALRRTALLALFTIAGIAASSSAADAETWFVRAGAPPSGDGSRPRPLDSLADAQRVSRPGETIVVLASRSPLDGGIQLKPGQTLRGAGPPVRSLPPGSRGPRLTNSDPASHDGDAVVLADRTTVSNLLISDSQRGGIYGLDVSGVRVVGNDISGHNASCAPGFLIPPFNAPTNVPGVGVPISEGLLNGWAGIMIDASRRRAGRAVIESNRVHDALCGDGIDVRLSGVARYSIGIRGNLVTRLQEGPDFESLLAIGLQTHDRARLKARLDRNRQSHLGNPDDPNGFVLGGDTEGLFINPVGPSRIDVSVNRNTYTNAAGLGGFSSNGMEMVSMGDGSRAEMVIRNSSFSGSPGDLFEEGGLGTNASLSLKLVNVVVTRSVGFGNSGAFPFNNGDCLLAGSLGAGNRIELQVIDSELSHCANNGLSVGSNVVNGTGPTKSIDVTVSGSEIVANRGANLGVRNYTGLEQLSIEISDTDLTGARGFGSGSSDIVFDELGSTGSAAIDLGGGSLGSAGGNCIVGGPMAASVLGYEVSAAGNWWGVAGGPPPGRTLVIDGRLDFEPALAAPPPSC